MRGKKGRGAFLLFFFYRKICGYEGAMRWYFDKFCVIIWEEEGKEEDKIKSAKGQKNFCKNTIFNTDYFKWQIVYMIICHYPYYLYFAKINENFVLNRYRLRGQGYCADESAKLQIY